MANKFYDLDIWKQGFNLLMKVYEVTKRFPKEEIFSLTSQMQRSANGVIASIAETHGRYHFADKIRILYIARGELEETQSHLRVALKLGYIKETTFVELDKVYEDLNRRLNAYISSLKPNHRLTD